MFPARPAPETLLKPSEAARLLGVRPTTLASWARAGRLTAQVTPGGHRRYRAADIYAIIEASGGTDADAWKDDAVRLYEQGWSIRQVAEKFDRDYGSIRRLLLRRKVGLRHRGHGHRP